MNDDRPAIEPQNVPFWIIASFCVAVIALMLGFYSVYHDRAGTVVTQAQVQILNNKIEALKSELQRRPAAPAAPGAPAQPAAEPAAATPAK